MATLDGEGVRVVLVGTGSHATGSRLPDVPAVESTVRALKSCLLDVCGVREGNLVSLLNPDGPEPFLDAVIAAASAASDVLLIYYVGHGAVSVAGELHLATRATVDLTEKAAYQALPYSEIIGVLVNCRARLVVVVLDCCYSGRAGNPVRSGALLGSADYDEQALAPRGEPYTAFSGELIRALRQGVPTAPVKIKLQHLHDHLSRAMRARNRPVPILQTGNLAGELVLAPNHAYRSDEGTSAPDSVPPWDGACPYRGLEPFTAADEHVFYGRADLTDQVIHRLGERVRRGGITVVAGPSGSGKTSLLAAGILPTILHGNLGILGSSHWPHLSMTPGDDPLSVLAAQLAQLRPGADAASIRAELAAGPEQARAAVARVAAAYPASPGVEAPQGRLVIVVDQFEELFTPAVSDVDRRAFITALDAAATQAESAAPVALVILGLRSDFNGRCARFPKLVAALENNQVVVGPMTTAELRSAVVEPAEQAGLTLQAGLVDLLLRDTGADPGDDHSADYEPGALPLLSHALLTTWQRRRGNLLTVEGYREVGGVAGAISTTAERTFTTLEPAIQQAAKRLLLQMVRVGEDIPDTRRRVRRADVLEAFPDKTTAATALEAFAKSRLVTVDADTAEITHEALIRSWPRLRNWINADRAGRLVTQELEAAAGAWKRGGRDTALLYRGSRLAAARTRSEASNEGELSATAVDFLAASSHHERRAVRVRHTVIAVLVVLIMLTTTGVIIAVNRGNRLDRQLAVANAQNLATAAASRAVDDPVFATKLALASWHLDPTSPAARDALAHQYLAMQSVDTIYTNFTDRRIDGLYSSPDGNTLILALADDVTVVSGFLSPAPTTWTVPGTAAVSRIVISPNGRWLFGVGADGTVLLWDVPARGGPDVLFRGGPPTATSHYIAGFSPDESRLAIVGPSATGASRELTLWNPAHRTRLPTPPSVLGNQPVTKIWLTKDPNAILVRTEQTDPTDLTTSTRLTTRSLSDGTALHTFPPDSPVVRRGQAVATCTPGDPVRETPASVTLLAPDTAAQFAQIPITDSSCSSTSLSLTADTDHIIEGVSALKNIPSQPVRLISLFTGDSYDFAMSPRRDDLMRTSDSLLVDVDPSMTVIESQGGPPTILMARNSSILRVNAATRDWLGGIGISSPKGMVGSDRRYVVVQALDRYLVLDRQSGQQLGRLARSSIDWGETNFVVPMVTDALHLLVHSGGAWRLLRYRLPSLDPDDPLVLPGPLHHLSSDRIGLQGDDDRIVAAAGGVLSVWDTRTKTMIGTPLTLGDTPDEQNRFRSYDNFTRRPGHPDEIAIIAPDRSIQLWNLSQRRRFRTIPTNADAIGSTPSFDATGTRLIILTSNHTLEQWDVDTGTQVRTPLPAPDTAQILGFTRDGYLLSATLGETLQLWDLNQGLVSGTMPLDTAEVDSGGDVTIDRIRVYKSGLMPGDLPITAQLWSDRLCSTSGRNFTARERTTLPPGVGSGNPCTS